MAKWAMGTMQQYNPTPTPTNSFGANRTVVSIASGYDHTCVILDNGSVSCWGQNSYGALGRGTVGGVLI